MSRTFSLVVVVILILLSFAAGYWLGLQDGRKQIIDKIHQNVPEYEESSPEEDDKAKIS